MVRKKKRKERRRADRGGQGGASGKPLRAELNFFEPSGQTLPLAAVNAPTMQASEIVQMAQCLAIGMCDQKFRWNLPPIQFRGFQATAAYWRYWENLGKIASASCRNQTIYFKLPAAEAVISLLEKRRLQWLHSLRVLFLDSEEFVSAFMGGQFFEAEQQQRIYPAHILSCNHMLIYTRDRYKMFPNPSVGWKRGRATEMNTLRLQVPDPDQWSNDSQEFIRRFVFELEDYGGFVVPGEGQPTGPRQAKGGPVRPTYAPERVLFSMSLSAYQEMRALSGRNRYGYMAILFGQDPQSSHARVGLDTVEIGHCFLGFVGPLDRVLSVAQVGTMTQLRQNPMCVRDLIHDPRGNWKVGIREWLGC